MLKQSEQLKAAKSLMQYFTSNNGVPVDKATIQAKSAEVVALAAAIRKATGEQV